MKRIISTIYRNRNTYWTDFWDRIDMTHHRVSMTNYYSEGNRKKIIDSVELTNEQIKAIDEFYIMNYGKKVPYLWHRFAYACTGKFDETIFPASVYLSEFERYLDDNWKHYRNALTDKNFMALLGPAMGVRVPTTIISKVKGLWRDRNYHLISEAAAYEELNDLGKVFLKDTFLTYGGRSCRVVDFHNGVDLISGKSAKEIIQSMSNDIAIQECIKTSETLSRLNPGTVNTFRIMTYNWKGKIEPLPVAARMGCSDMVVDNLHSGGLIIAVDNDGTFHEKAINMDSSTFFEHPDTKVKFGGYKVDKVPELIDKCIYMHEMMPQLGIVSWDMTVAENGDPLLIEMNMRWEDIMVPQMTHGVGAFGDNTAEILQWIKKLRHVKASKRYKYAYGKMD